MIVFTRIKSLRLLWPFVFVRAHLTFCDSSSNGFDTATSNLHARFYCVEQSEWRSAAVSPSLAVDEQMPVEALEEALLDLIFSMAALKDRIQWLPSEQKKKVSALMQPLVDILSGRRSEEPVRSLALML